MLACLDCDIRHAFFFPAQCEIRFIALPVDGMTPDTRKLKALFVGAPGLFKPSDANAREFCDLWRDEFAPLEGQPFNPQLYLELLGKVASAQPAIEGGGNSGGSTRSDPGQVAQPSTRIVAQPFDRSALSPDAAARNANDAYADNDDRAWAKGKHLRVDPGTAVLNAVDFEFISESGISQSIAASTKGDSLASAESVGVKPFTPTVASASPDRLSSSQMSSLAGGLSSEDAVAYPGTQVLDLLPNDGEARPVDYLLTDVISEQSNAAPCSSAAVGATTVATAAIEPAKRFRLMRQRTSERFVVSGDRFVVGKSKYSSFQVANTTTVSRSHAIFACDSEGCWIYDNDSKNGTFVNGVRLEPHKRRLLRDNDSIRMSDEVFIFSVEPSGAKEAEYAI